MMITQKYTPMLLLLILFLSLGCQHQQKPPLTDLEILEIQLLIDQVLDGRQLSDDPETPLKLIEIQF